MPNDRPVPRFRVPGAVAALLLAMAVLAVGQAPDAYGHAAGPVPEARLSAEGPVVEIVWTAAPDDTAAIGAVVGILPRSVSEAYIEGTSKGLPSEDEVTAFSRSRALRDYLLDNVGVAQDGVACDGAVVPADDFIADGARFTFVCPEPVGEAEVTITILQDDDPTYRTFSVDGTEQFAMHTSAVPTHAWDFTAATGERSLPAIVPIGAGVLVLGGLASLRLIRPRRRDRRAEVGT